MKRRAVIVIIKTKFNDLEIFCRLKRVNKICEELYTKDGHVSLLLKRKSILSPLKSSETLNLSSKLKRTSLIRISKIHDINPKIFHVLKGAVKKFIHEDIKYNKSYMMGKTESARRSTRNKNTTSDLNTLKRIERFSEIFYLVFHKRRQLRLRSKQRIYW